MADGGATFYIAMAAAAAGTVVTTLDTIDANRRRQAILEQEIRSEELAALDEEVQRLRALRMANDELLVGADGIDAWASPSLIAAREFNFKMGLEDIANSRYNVGDVRAGIGARINILKRNTRASAAAGIFEIAGIAASTANASSMLKKPPTGTNAISGSGINADLGVGILDTPGGTGALA